MASEAKQKQTAKQHPEGKPKAEKPKVEAKEHKEKKAKPSAEATDADTPKPPPPPRMPSDPRIKILKQFHAKLLPRGDLRDRYRVLLQRWDSSEDHGGVTVNELQTLLNDRKSDRDNRARGRKS